MRYSFLVNAMKKLLKSGYICRSCCKKFTATFLCPTAYTLGYNRSHQSVPLLVLGAPTTYCNKLQPNRFPVMFL